MYSKLTAAQKDQLLIEYRRARDLGATDPMHAVACAAHTVLNRGSIRKLNSARNGDALAATLMFLVFTGEIKATDPAWPQR